jgi:DNA-binding CsgD family transcriptional regulator
MATDLTQRESEVLGLAIEGLSNDEIAARLDISRRTVETHMHTLFKKTGATRRGQLARLSGPLRDERAATSDAGRRLALYQDVLDRLVERHLTLVDEQVEFTFTLGDGTVPDEVVERRWTLPKPYLVYRMLRPVVVDGGDAGAVVPDPDELGLACEVRDRDVWADVRAVVDPDGQPKAVVFFQPGLDGRTEWLLRYRSPRLWDRFRETGRDTLSWATATFAQRHRPTITELTVHFVLPAGWREATLAEQGGHGTAQVEALPGGRTRLTWHHGGPDAPDVAAAYEWVLRGERE